MKRLKLKRSLAVFISTLMILQTFIPIFGFADSETVQEPNVEGYEELLEEALPVEEVTVNIDEPEEAIETEEVSEDKIVENDIEVTEPDVEEELPKEVIIPEDNLDNPEIEEKEVIQEEFKEQEKEPVLEKEEI